MRKKNAKKNEISQRNERRSASINILQASGSKQDSNVLNYQRRTHIHFLVYCIELILPKKIQHDSTIFSSLGFRKKRLGATFRKLHKYDGTGNTIVYEHIWMGAPGSQAK
jgi:hypothetical protein